MVSKTLSSLLAVLAFCAPVMAQVPVTNVAPLPATVIAPKMATVTPFITGLKEAQGMALDGKSLLVCDYGAGEILRFGMDGKPLAKLATGLKGPAAIVNAQGQIFVSERKASRVVRFQNGKMDVVMADVAEPLGLVVHLNIDGMGGVAGAIFPVAFTVVSHTTSKIYRVSIPSKFHKQLILLKYAAPVAAGDDKRYGFRWLASDERNYLMSDEVGERILMLTENGRVATFATGISDPSGIAIGPYPDREIYVANEGDGGQLIRLSADGEKTVVAEKLGRPRGILFLDAKTVLVSNRDGNVWKVALP